MAAVGAVVVRERDAAQAAFVAEVPGGVGRGEDAVLLGDGRVGPPVERGGGQVRVADPDAHQEEVGVLGEPEVDLEGQVPQPLPLPEAEHLAAVGGGDAGGVQRGAGEGGVAGGADVPLDAPGVPGAVEGEVGGLEHRVAVEEFTAGRLVEEGVDASAEAGQDGGAQPAVLQDEGGQGGGDAAAFVAVQDAGGQQRGQRGEREPARHVRREPRDGRRVDGVGLVERAQRGQWVDRPQGCGGQGQPVVPDRGRQGVTPLTGALLRAPRRHGTL